MSKHTPLPWHIDDVGNLRSKDNPCIALVATDPFNAEEGTANGEFIVRAVNVHDELLEACKAAEVMIHADCIARDLIRAAILKAQVA